MWSNRSISVTWPRAGCLLLVILLLSILGCGGGDDGDSVEMASGANLPQGSERVDLDPAEFSPKISNVYWPMAPGSRWVYRERDSEGGVQRVVVTVTDQTKRVANGVVARIVHDVVSEDGRPVEVTADWYAQDAEGNLWYMGERTAEYENGRAVSRAGSWEAGVDGAQPGIIMAAEPEPGLAYRQEYYAGEAEDRAKVLSVDEQVEVPYGHFTHAVLTKDLTPLEPRALEYKLYARGVGPVLTLDASGESGREELLSFRKSAGGY